MTRSDPSRPRPAPAPAPASELGFSQVREDPAAELALVRELADARRRPVRVAMIASGGCTALALLARPEVARIEAVDANPAQLHLVALRALAAARLDAAEQLVLLGADPRQPAGGPEAVYARLRVELPAEARAWWDARPAQVAYGLNRVGRFETLFRELAAALAAEGLDPVERPGEALIHPGWHGLFQRVFRHERLVELFGERAVMYSTRRSFAEHFAEAFATALRRHDPRTNPFLHQVFRDAYPAGEAGLPAYMQREAGERMRRRGVDDMALHLGTLETRAAALAAAGPFDLIQTSNVTDWMPAAATRELFAGLRGLLAPGGVILARRLNGDYDLAAELGAHVAVDAARSAALTREDRTGFYRETVVGVSA